MESADSGSLPNGVGVGVGVGDDGFDSRVDFLSPFFSSTSMSAAINATYPPTLLSSSTSDGHRHLGCPSLSYLDSSTPLLPLDSAAAAPAWPRPLLIPSSSDCTTAGGCSRSQSVQLPNQPAASPRSSKKRSRASRRAPTTVLTTDTSNFRAMVQEFTGVPSPPFPSAAAPFCSSPFTRSPFDRFHSPSAASPPLFVLRPFPQKVQSSSPSPAADPFPPLSSVTNTSSSAAENSNYRLPSRDPSLGGGRSRPLLSPQSPPLSSRTLLRANYTVPTETTTGSNASLPLAEHVADELGGLPPELIGSGAMRSTWLSDSAVADSAQLRHAVLESSRRQNHSASWSPSEVSREMTAVAPRESEAAGTGGETRHGGVMDSLF